MNVKQAIVTAGRVVRRERQAVRNRAAVAHGTRPGRVFFSDALGSFLGVDDAWLEETAVEYRHCPAAWRHLSGLRSPSGKTDGFAKSLDVAEGFAVWALVKHLRPRVILELGVQFGISSRLWKEALSRYVPRHELILCDLEDHRRFIGDDESTFVRGDAYELLPDLFSSRDVDVLHNDAHPYKLIRFSVEEAMKRGIQTLTFHDVGRGPRRPYRPESSRLSVEEKMRESSNIGRYGHWERHVMADVFDERILHADQADGELYRIRIFDSLFGFGVALNQDGTRY